MKNDIVKCWILSADKFVETRKKGICHLPLIVTVGELCGLVGIGKKAAFSHYGGIISVIAQVKLLAAQLCFSHIVGLEIFHEKILQY